MDTSGGDSGTGPVCGHRWEGLTPTAKCCRRFAALLERPGIHLFEDRCGYGGWWFGGEWSFLGWRPGDCHIKSCRAPAVSWFRGERRSHGWPRSAEETCPTGLPYRAAQPRRHFAFRESLGEPGGGLVRPRRQRDPGHAGRISQPEQRPAARPPENLGRVRAPGDHGRNLRKTHQAEPDQQSI